MRRFLDWSNSLNSPSTPTVKQSTIASRRSNTNTNINTMTTIPHQSTQTDLHHIGTQSRSSTSHQFDQHQTSDYFNPARDHEIQHLIKFLHEIKYYQASSSPLPSASNSQSQKEFADKVYCTLPLFLNVFSSNNLHQGVDHSQSVTNPDLAYQNNRTSNTDISILESSYNCNSSSSSRQTSPLPISGQQQHQSPSLERFPELLPFAYTVARLFVSDCRQRASNKHAEEASKAILLYLSEQLNKNHDSEKESDKEHLTDQNQQSEGVPRDAELSQGWNLLLTLNTLASSRSSQLIQLLCDASLPSTLVKCLYLLFDLPKTAGQQLSTSSQSESRTSEKNISPSITVGSCSRSITEFINKILIKIFTQLLVKLCSHKAAIDELIKKDDLRLLMGIASSHCSIHNRSWRQVAFETLVAISRNMTENFHYLELNNSIQVYLDNIQRIDSLGLVTIGESVDMIKILLEFLYNIDVNNRAHPRSTGPLMAQLKNSRINELIQDLLHRVDQIICQDDQLSESINDETIVTNENQLSVSSEAGNRLDNFRVFGRRLIHSLSILAKININPETTMTNLSTLKPVAGSRFEMLDQFKMPRPSSSDCILNYQVLELLKSEWSRRKDSHLIEAILDVTISLFNDDKFNYFIFESHQILVYYMTSQNFSCFPHKIKQKLFKFLEFIIIEIHYIPCLELVTLSNIIKKSSDSDLALGLKTFIACLRFDSKFSDIFREIGILETIVDLLIQDMQYNELNRNHKKLEVLYLLLETSQYLLAGPNNINCTQFNESRAARLVFNYLSKPEFSYLFVPAHSSSSDDSTCLASSTSRTSTPPTSANYNKTGSEANLHMRATPGRPSIKQLQKVAFTIIRQLILSTAGDEHLANLLGLLARNFDDLKKLDGISRSTVSAPEATATDILFLLSQEVNLKICILKSLMIVLKDSHRCRALFRKAGGFLYLISSLNSLQNSLSSAEVKSDLMENFGTSWSQINSRKIWRLIKSIFMTIVMAMRLEPVSQRTFSEDVLDKFTQSLHRLGCFSSSELKGQASTSRNEPIRGENLRLYKAIFLSPPNRDYSTIPSDNITPSESSCQLFRFLFDMSLDLGDGTAELEEYLEKTGNIYRLQQSMSFDYSYKTSREVYESNALKRRSQANTAPRRPPSLDLITKIGRASLLAYPSVILTIIDLVPSSPDEDLSTFISFVILSLFKYPRNQRLLCEAGLIRKLLESEFWSLSLTDKSHYLHDIAQSMFEKLTKQSVTAKELRSFLRLGEPLGCKNLDDIILTESSEETRQKYNQESSKSALPPHRVIKDKIPYERIETFVSMMSTDKFRFEPPFVEFDMINDGPSSIFMPSIAPINSKGLSPYSCSFLNSTLDIHMGEKNGILGGVGTTERPFPPAAGITYSAWICIEKFPLRSSDPNHNIRLLTLYRGSAASGKEYSCFRIQVSALDRAVLISTQELPLFETEKADSSTDSDYNLRIWSPELLVEDKWHHLAVTLSKSSTKQSGVHVYLDGQSIYHQRLCYISNSVGSINSGSLGSLNSGGDSSSAAAYVNAFIGSLPQYRYQLKAHWKLGPFHLVDEPLTHAFISMIHSLGPNYIGNFQSQQKVTGLSSIKGAQLNQLDRLTSHLPEKHRALVHQHSVATHGHQGSNHGPPLARVSSAGGSQPTSTTYGSHQQTHHCIAEDRILMSLDARAVSYMTLSRMRRIYTRFDCRQVSRVLGPSSHENSLPIMLLHNTGVHLNGPSRGVGAFVVGYNQVRSFVPTPTHQTMVCLGGSYILIGLIAQAQTKESLYVALKAMVNALKNNVKLQSQMDSINGYQILSVFFWKKSNLLTPNILKLTFSLITDCSKLYFRVDNHLLRHKPIREIHQLGALRDLICECFDLWLQTDMIDLVLDFIHELINSNNQEQVAGQDCIPSVTSCARTTNLKYLRDMDLLPRMLRLLPQYDSQQMKDSEGGFMRTTIDEKIKITGVSFDTKAIYLIRQTVFELLNRTPRQSDILYFGQFLASLLPSKQEERDPRTVSLRNILLRSLLQMMTKNRQREVNDAVQEELVRILGFDWFMLFISNSKMDEETTLLGLINLMVVLSNDDLYLMFKTHPHANKACNGGWLKEPVFPTIDGKFNIQLLGINIGVFFGLSGKRKSIKQDILDAPNFFLLRHCLMNLVHYPRAYLTIFQTMMNRMNSLEPSVIESLEAFDQLTLDTLCDCLVGDTHHKRRQTLSQIQFKCHELVVCLIYMMRDIMWQPSEELKQGQPSEKGPSDVKVNQETNYPIDLARFLMYLYNNNNEFQDYFRNSSELIDALCESIIMPSDETKASIDRPMTKHAASKEILELSRLIILDKMIEPNSSGGDQQVDYLQLAPFERFLDSLACCKEAQGQLVDMLLHQILLMIDSTARHNSIKTIGSSENVLQFQLLLTNSITVVETVTDKIWQQELYCDSLARVLNIIDHQLCLAEQIFKFNGLLPKHNPPYAFIMQRVLNRTLLFALSRPLLHMSDKMLMLDLLKKISDNRTIIILNHMHSPHSAEFFVCLVLFLLKIIEENSPGNYSTSTLELASQPSSLIEKQFGHPSGKSPQSMIPNSTDLMLASMARKVWDAIYQSKKGILSEAFEISLSLPAFTLDTSLDLVQLKPDIIDTCERFYSAVLEAEQKPKKRGLQRSTEPSSGNATSAAVNMLSGRLTRVVNAASFVSRVVGATAGSMASNVNLVGEKLTQSSKVNRMRDGNNRSSPSMDSLSSGNNSNQTPSISNSNLTQTATHANSNTTTVPQFKSDQAELFRHNNLGQTQVMEATQTHISIVEDFIQGQLSQKNHKLALHKYLCDEWLDTEYEVMLRERALFGPDRASSLDKWCLDMTEGPRRMRKKMINNTRQFYQHYQYQPEQYNPSNKSLRYRPPMSYDSHEYFMKTLSLDNNMLDVSMETASEVDDNDNDNKLEAFTAPETNNQESKNDQPTSINVDLGSTPAHTTLTSLNSTGFLSSTESLNKLAALNTTVAECSSSKHSDIDPDEGDSTSFVDFSPEIEAESNSARNSENIDSLSVLRLLEKSERISHMFRCSRVQGLDTYEGLLLFGKEHFYLIDGFTLLKTREIKDIDSLPPDGHDPIIPSSTPKINTHSRKTCAKFSFDNIVEVHKRRYLLQPIALEVFSSDGRNSLIVFPRNIRNKVYSRLITVANHLNSNTHESLAGQKSNVSVEGGSGILSNLIGDTSVTQRWVRGELSNFQYLMNLNTIAGRSYNDLMQYPIFPWILADYTSDTLDLTKASTFRNLSRPVGAQTSERLEQFKRRYMDWDDTETPPYHYGTFYSSAMIVASYMVRMEPFTQHFLRLQGGHFDLADRMFHSIHDSWLSASKHNMADIKELVPEFFYLPEFLKNENKYDLGIKQSGMKLHDVILPPWAKNDTREFIRLHRSALESDYVSAHLHEWIDLIFGYKQQGQAAVDAVNVFHHLFYEGNVDIYNTDIDPIKKNAVIGFINNFGQVPKQLFKKPHPARKVGSGSTHTSAMPALTPILPVALATSNATSGAFNRVLTQCPERLRLSETICKELRGPVGQIVHIDKNLVSVEQNKLLIPPEFCRYIAWGHPDRSLRLGLYDSEKPIFVWEGSDNMWPNEILCCTIPNSRTMITGGTDSMITIWKIDKMRSFAPVSNLYGHVEPVTCLASSQAYSLIVSGSRDRTAIIWDLNRLTYVRQLGYPINSDQVVHSGPISAIAINDSTGDIATCASSHLYLWTINGELLAQVDTQSVLSLQSISATSSISANLGQVHLLSVCFSQHHEWDADEVIITGASDGTIAFWSMGYYQSPMTESDLDAQAKRIEELGGQNQDPAVQAHEEIQQARGPTDVSVDEEADAGTDKESITSVERCKGPVGARTSDPIEITRPQRRRTDTMNSEWVRLSASSTSTTAETIPILKATPSSIGDDQQAMMSSTSPPEKMDSDSSFIQTLSSTPVQLKESLNSVDRPQPELNNSIEEGLLGVANNSNDPSSIKFSKSDTSLVESFVILGNDSTQRNQHTPQTTPSDRIRPQSSMGTTRPSLSSPHRARRRLLSADGHTHTDRLDSAKLLPNHCWRRELYIRHAINRRNGKPALGAVTSLAISKDHKTLFAGDTNGRILSWSTS